jgi:hypothetical protein
MLQASEAMPVALVDAGAMARPATDSVKASLTHHSFERRMSEAFPDAMTRCLTVEVSRLH